MRNYALQLRWLFPEQRVPAAPVLVKFLVFIQADNNTARLAHTLRSVHQQRHPARWIVICDASGQPAHLPPLGANDWRLDLQSGDILTPEALQVLAQAIKTAPDAVLIYCDHDHYDGNTPPANPHFKPALNPDLLRSYPYIGRVFAARADLFNQQAAITARPLQLTAAYALCLFAIEQFKSEHIVRVPLVLAHLNPAIDTVFAATSETWHKLSILLEQHAQRLGIAATLNEGPAPGTFHFLHPLTRTPKVSILIPTKEQLPYLQRCLESILAKTVYPNYEIIIIDNGSTNSECVAYLRGMETIAPERIRVLYAPGPFNFSRLNNQAAQIATGEFLLLLNNDTAVFQADWLNHLMRHGLRPEVGAVGARLLFPGGKVQHAGVVLGLAGPAEHPFLGLEKDQPGYLFRAQVTQNYSAVTAACLLVKKELYLDVNGLNETDFAVGYNDVDFCLRLAALSKQIVWTPLAILLHEGSASQRRAIESAEKKIAQSDKKQQRFRQEQGIFYNKWPQCVANDSAYSPGLSLVNRSFEIETNALLTPPKNDALIYPKVIAFPADMQGCGNYRIIQPMLAMLDDQLIEGGLSYEIFGANLVLRSGADTLIFQRPHTDIQITLLEELLQLNHIKKIYEVDDLLFNIPLKSIHRDAMPADIRKRLTKAIGLCDRLIVSTAPLAEQLNKLNRDVRVVENCLPAHLWGINPPQRVYTEANKKRKPRIGWAGGVGHQGDLELVQNVITALADEVEWEFFGMCPERLQPVVKRFINGIPTPYYPARLMSLVSQWDLAIAPLEDNPFNRCKSNLRLLEYGWCGVPVVCSNLLPYQGNLPVTRIKNRHKDWIDAIRSHLADPFASYQQGLALQQAVVARHLLRGQNLTNWLAAWHD
ncbi:glycosyltransferase [Rhodoferax sp. 4810]|nr:glycosyltransferase [Rhodoferax jenense]